MKIRLLIVSILLTGCEASSDHLEDILLACDRNDGLDYMYIYKKSSNVYCKDGAFFEVIK